MSPRPISQNFGAGAVFVQQGIYETSTTQKHRIGERLQLGNRTFRYASAGAALSAGFVAQQAPFGGATTTLQITCALTVAAAVGDTKIYVNALTTAQTANTFAEGWAAVWDATTAGVSYLYHIKSNSALATTGTSSYITIYDEVHIALATADQMNLITSPYKGVVVAEATSATGSALGIAPVAVASGSYFWLQTYGPAAVYTVAALDHTDTVCASDDTAASVGKTASNTLHRVIGYPLHVGTAGEAGIIFLTLAA